MPTLSWQATKQLCALPLRRAGYSPSEADRVAEHLVAAEAGGVVSLGLSRVIWIVELVTSGRPTSDPSALDSSSNSHVAIEGNGGLGYLAVEKALALALPLAREHGVAIASARNIFLTGVLRVYAHRLADEGLACFITSSAAPAILVAPGGTRPVLGTNPIAFGVPDKSGQHLVFDTSSTQISYSELRANASLGQSLPVGVAVDAHGSETTDAQQALDGGLLPWGGHRGYGMAVAVAAMGMLVGAPPAPIDLSSCGFLAVVFDPQVVGSGLADTLELRGVLEGSMVPGTPARLPGAHWQQSQSNARQRGLSISDELFTSLRDLPN